MNWQTWFNNFQDKIHKGNLRSAAIEIYSLDWNKEERQIAQDYAYHVLETPLMPIWSILNKLVQLSLRKPKLKLDDPSHFLTPLTLSEVEEIETAYEIRFPEEYRNFLLYVSRGGVGPENGLFPLRRAKNGWWHWEGDGAEKVDWLQKYLKIPFPHNHKFSVFNDPYWDTEEWAKIECELRELAGSDEMYEELWSERHDEEVGRLAQKHYEEGTDSPGAIRICHYGCAIRNLLIISGKKAGQIWEESDGYDGINEIIFEGKPLTFQKWYERWLDESLNISSE